ncbi:hypothetical protein J6590_021186 [Homalodisca vitripennis]|nr:hypothetical protein J6590_021186 [Homalodisca vitripennis]
MIRMFFDSSEVTGNLPSAVAFRDAMLIRANAKRILPDDGGTSCGSSILRFTRWDFRIYYKRPTPPVVDHLPKLYEKKEARGASDNIWDWPMIPINPHGVSITHILMVITDGRIRGYDYDHDTRTTDVSDKRL